MTLRYGLGDSVSISTYIGYVGEIGINTTTQTIHVFDGSTAGGTALAKLSEVGGGGGSSVNYWASNASGIYTTRNVAIGTNIISLGSTVLLVKGDTKIIGILTIGQGTITLDPNTNTISADNLTGTATTATNLADAANITTGTINSARLSGTYNIDISGNAATADYADVSGIATYATTAGVSTSIIGGIGSIAQLQVTGISTFFDGPIFIGSATSTGTASQRLQVTGNAYISGNLGIGSTNPTSKLHVVGDALITGVSTIGTLRIASGIVTATSGIITYYGDGSQLTGISKILTVGTRVGSAVTFNISGSSFNVSGRSGDISISI